MTLIYPLKVISYNFNRIAVIGFEIWAIFLYEIKIGIKHSI